MDDDEHDDETDARQAPLNTLSNSPFTFQAQFAWLTNYYRHFRKKIYIKKATGNNDSWIILEFSGVYKISMQTVFVGSDKHFFTNKDEATLSLELK